MESKPNRWTDRRKVVHLIPSHTGTGGVENDLYIIVQATLTIFYGVL